MIGAETAQNLISAIEKMSWTIDTLLKYFNPKLMPLYIELVLANATCRTLET